MPSSNVSYGTNSIVIGETGDYEVEFAINPTYQELLETNLYVQVTRNGARIPSLVLYHNGLPAAEEVFALGTSAIVHLTAGDVIQLQMQTTRNADVNIYQANLSVKKLDTV
jgi:hypothetical protein